MHRTLFRSHLSYLTYLDTGIQPVGSTDVTRDPQGTRCKVPCGYLVFCPHVSWQVGLTPTVWRYVSVAPM